MDELLEISPQKFFSDIVKRPYNEAIYHYNAHYPSGLNDSLDASYSRKITLLKPIGTDGVVHDVFEAIRNDDEIKRIKATGKRMTLSVENAMVYILENFGLPNVLVRLDPKTLLVAALNSESINYAYKVDEDSMVLLGGLVVLKPNHFVIVELP